eukprot:GHUV01038258.1.p1 GENE.GHUV01038258.1~~GHUV01038258.1.p1  ORF type:complete len:173 (+),score=45.36 GHUV01038258.1:649-1167(+)
MQLVQLLSWTACWSMQSSTTFRDSTVASRPAICHLQSPWSCSMLAVCTGIIRRAAEQIVNTVDALRTKLKPGESITVKAYGLELYNEELRDLSTNVAGAQPISGPAADGEGSKGETGVRIAERPIGRDGKCIPEVGATSQLAGVDQHVLGLVLLAELGASRIAALLQLPTAA